MSTSGEGFSIPATSVPPHGGYQHSGDHGWGAHDGHPLHSHHPVTGKIRWATDDEIRRLKQEVPPSPFLDPMPAERCGRFGCLLPAGHNQGMADIPENHDARTGRCPDGGTCHGSAIAAGSGVCEPGTCYRVRTCGPLSNVFPGDQWPREVLIANGVIPPDGDPRRKAAGDGIDGAAVLDGVTEVPWASLAGKVYYLTRDVHLTGLTIEHGVTLAGSAAPTPWRLYCQGTITNRGTIVVAIEWKN